MTLAERVERGLARPVRPEVRALAAELAAEAGAYAALFYGSNLRTGSLEGVVDLYLLTPGAQRDRIWPRVSYVERTAAEGATLRAKCATMSLATFARAATGLSRDTTIWARFVQPCALAWVRDETTRTQVRGAVAAAIRTAARTAAALGPERGVEAAYWRALFRATYAAEFRVEKPGREDHILSLADDHFDGLLPLAWTADRIGFARDGDALAPELPPAKRRAILRWWRARRRLGRPLNLLRLTKAARTFDGAAAYGLWKIERHTGVALELTPFRERHPVLAAPGALLSLWRRRLQR